jgi:hypothetical protein
MSASEGAAARTNEHGQGAKNPEYPAFDQARKENAKWTGDRYDLIMEIFDQDPAPQGDNWRERVLDCLSQRVDMTGYTAKMVSNWYVAERQRREVEAGQREPRTYDREVNSYSKQRKRAVGSVERLSDQWGINQLTLVQNWSKKNPGFAPFAISFSGPTLQYE